MFFFLFCFCVQVSAVTDQTGMLDVGGNPGDFDDDEGGGLVS
jgi:RNA-binding protein 39